MVNFTVQVHSSALWLQIPPPGMTIGFRGPVLKYVGHSSGLVIGDKFSYFIHIY